MNSLRWIVTLAYAGGIFYLSSKPWSGIPPIPYLDVIMHFVLYAGLAVLCLWSLRGSRFGSRPGAPLMAVGLATAYGVLDEIHQSFVPGRTCTVEDALTDAAGAVAGTALFVLLSRCCCRRAAGCGRQA